MIFPHGPEAATQIPGKHHTSQMRHNGKSSCRCSLKCLKEHCMLLHVTFRHNLIYQDSNGLGFIYINDYQCQYHLECCINRVDVLCIFCSWSQHPNLFLVHCKKPTSTIRSITTVIMRALSIITIIAITGAALAKLKPISQDKYV